MPTIKASVTNTNGNTRTMNINLTTGKAWLVNQHNILLSFPTVMFLRNDLNGSGEKLLSLRSALDNVTSYKQLVKTLNTETKLNWK